jgi:2-C-methyl-D-erythritol 4-phosphate cytidylyltransferase
VAALSQRWAAVAPGLPVADTLKLVDDDGAVARTVDRSGLWGVQTPQVFTRGTLAELHGALADPPGATDDLGLVEHAGGAVRLIEGEATNFKVTYPGDLALAEAVLSVRRAPAG